MESYVRGDSVDMAALLRLCERRLHSPTVHRANGVSLLGKGNWTETKENYKRSILTAGEGNEYKAHQFALECEPACIEVVNVTDFTLSKDGLVFLSSK